MRMFGPKSLSYYLFYLTRMASLSILLLIGFFLISLLTHNYQMINGQFQMAIPFLPETFIKGFYRLNILVTITLVMVFIMVFFYLLSNIFKTFKAPKLFTGKAIKQLNYFGLLNLVAAPLLFLIIDFLIMEKQQIGNILNYLLTFILGIFLLFIAAIFKQGHQVQNENDLTI